MSDDVTSPPAELDRPLIHFLKRQSWTPATIAELLGQDQEAILAVWREPIATAPASKAAPFTAKIEPTLRVRLSPDARRLQILLPAKALPLPTEVLLAQIQDHCIRQKIEGFLTAQELARRMQTWVYGTWLTVLEAIPPTPPTPGRVQLLVPVKTVASRSEGVAFLVRKGAVLARIEPGRAGLPGRDLVGQIIPPLQPRVLQLPQGQNTESSADGTTLIASCDGQVVMRQLRVHVLPFTVHEGDLTDRDQPLISDAGVIVTGSVREGGVIQAADDVQIHGGVYGGMITSTLGRISVVGPVNGTPRLPSELRTGLDIHCGQVCYATLEAGGDIVVREEARASDLSARGNIFVARPLAQSLIDARLTLGGGLIGPIPQVPSPAVAPTERRHTRIPVSIDAQVAWHEHPPLTFIPCVIADLTVAGARCRFLTPPAEELILNDIAQLKFQFPDGLGDAVIIARIARLDLPSGVGLSFQAITDRDADRVMQLCMQRLRELKGARPGSRADRRRHR